VDKIPQDLRVVCGGHDQSLLGPVVQDRLVRELAVLQRSLAALVGVDVGDLPNLYRLLGVLLAQGEPPHRRDGRRHPVPARHGVANACATHENLRPATFPGHALFSIRAGEAPAGADCYRLLVGRVPYPPTHSRAVTTPCGAE
jgi:hypothetical protein